MGMNTDLGPLMGQSALVPLYHIILFNQILTSLSVPHKLEPYSATALNAAENLPWTYLH